MWIITLIAALYAIADQDGGWKVAATFHIQMSESLPSCLMPGVEEVEEIVTGYESMYIGQHGPSGRAAKRSCSIFEV